MSPNTRQRVARALLLCGASLFAGCTSNTPPPKDSGHDTGEPSLDTGQEDTGQAKGDTGTLEAGTISGDCGVVAPGLATSESILFSNSIDFGKAFDESLLGDGAQEVLADGNLGGSSLYSEAVAFEVLDRCEGATLLKTEAEIDYQDSGGKKTDLLITIEDVAVGVSVTRAYHYPPEDGMEVEDAYTLLEDKLDDVLLSAANVASTDAWARSMLHVIAWDDAHAAAVTAAYDMLSTETADETVVFVTVTHGDDEALY